MEESKKVSLTDKKGIEEVISLHHSILHWSVLSIFGRKFLRFYYQEALNTGVFFCNVYRKQGKVLGFVTFTTDSRNLLWTIIKRNPFRFFRTIFSSFLSNPARLFPIFSSVSFSLFTKGDILPHINSEIIAFCVSPSHQKKGVGTVLFSSVSRELNKHGIKMFKVQTESINAAANSFYLRQGCTLSDKSHAFRGCTLHVYTKQLEKR